MTKLPRVFALDRREDSSGISGTGIIAYGTQYPNGKCTLAWNSDVSSVAVYDSIEELERIHGHNGKTKIVLL